MEEAKSIEISGIQVVHSACSPWETKGSMYFMRETTKKSELYVQFELLFWMGEYRLQIVKCIYLTFSSCLLST